MRRQVEILIIGQGICGSFLHLELEKAGVSHIVIDEALPFTASRVAAGLINPVTGRRLVTTWMIDQLLAFAVDAYQRLAGVLGSTFLEPVVVADLFPTAQMRLAFLNRLEEGGPYLRLPADEYDLLGRFHYTFGYGLIESCYLVDLPGLLAAVRRQMKEQHLLWEERFEAGELEVADTQIRYRDIEARRIIFCDGVASFSNPYFSRLPFAPNKGEALIVEIPEFQRQRTVFKKGISLVPWRDDLYWVGSSYEWSFEHAQPTEEFRQRTEAALREWLKQPFRTVEHLASVRPATLERRPFVGFHPVHTAVGILNGMGTKGCSLAPYFAHELVRFISTGSPIRVDADVKRFTRVLSRH
ncbi:NAD(P)/FAD-dependent oxidoreductase [Puia dinghuensis]|uniref:FAD-dependent oxidoreductase n=1 Tax=Puia dinghuensis TaxID=1792502 RepID=A0A8J2UEC0_9BACT|nr:FAD-dependent oxidoreductase [Puia dinghuensis]GGB04849.1 FAD-dependent oxidoreductase [Puia dinghuensis]